MINKNEIILELTAMAGQLVMTVILLLPFCCDESVRQSAQATLDRFERFSVERVDRLLAELQRMGQGG